MEKTPAYEAAKRRVETKMDFYTHLSVYGAVVLFLAIIDLVTSPGTIWFHWPLLGWGIAVTIHAIAVFVFPGGFAVTEKMIEEEMDRQRQDP